MSAGQLSTDVRPVADLTSDELERLLTLMQRHFLDVDRERFQQDLADKQWVLVFRDTAERIQGFSTLSKYTSGDERDAVTVIYSGDTIVDRAYWGRRALPRSWIRAVRSLHRADDPPDLYWLLLTSGFRTYRFLPVFWQRFHPCPKHNDAPLRRLRDRLAAERFGDAFDPDRGIVRLRHHYRLRPELAETPPGRREDDHINFFLRCNPGYTAGDELACIAPLDDGNLTRAGERMLRPR